jgi:hypothetical protein
MEEDIVKEIRPILMSGLRKGWTIAGQATYYRTKTLSYMQDMLFTPVALDIVTAKKKPIRPDNKVYRFVSDIEHAMENKHPFAFSIFRDLITQEKVIAIVVSFEKQLYIHILHVASRESFQDPHGFAYFAIALYPTIQHTVIDSQFLRSNTLIYVASGVALPSLKENVYAFVLGNGEKKIPGEHHVFSPTIINKTHI